MPTRKRSAGGWVALVIIAAVFASTASASPADDRSERIMRFAKSWRGVPFELGGDARSGIDCSAFVRRLYRAVFRVDLPRATKDQIRFGAPISIDPGNIAVGLRSGDLLFFVDQEGSPRHVVVYLKGGLIAHSAEGKGVVIEPVESVAGRYIAPRRIVAP